MTSERMHGKGKQALAKIGVNAFAIYMILRTDIIDQTGDLSDEVVLLLFIFCIRNSCMADRIV